jgi:hypothetical protein
LPRAYARLVAVWIFLASATVVCLTPFVWFGLSELWRVVTTQFTGPADITDFLGYYGAGHMARFDPAALYDTPAFFAYGSLLQGGRQATSGFLNPPFLAPVLEVLTLVPYGAAYALAAAFSLACYALAAWLIAPRWWGRHSWLIWLVGLPFFLPAQFGLIMGQSEMVTTAGFAVFAWSVLRAPRRSERGVLGLVVWAIKPNLLPALCIALVTARRWRWLCIGGAVLLTASGVSVALLGTQSWIGFVEVNTARLDMALANSTNLTEGITLYMLVRSVLGAGALTAAIGLAISVPVWLAVAVLWRPGPRDDERLYLQLAVLPVAACLTGVHAGSYELVSWLAAGWLLLRFAGRRPRYRPTIGALFLALWWAGSLCIVLEGPVGSAATVATGLAMIAACLYFNAAESSSSRTSISRGSSTPIPPEQQHVPRPRLSSSAYDGIVTFSP